MTTRRKWTKRFVIQIRECGEWNDIYFDSDNRKEALLEAKEMRRAHNYSYRVVERRERVVGK